MRMARGIEREKGRRNRERRRWLEWREGGKEKGKEEMVKKKASGMERVRESERARGMEKDESERIGESERKRKWRKVVKEEGGGMARGEGKRKRKEEWGKTKLRRVASWWEGKRKGKKNDEREKRKQYCSYQEHLFGSEPGRLVPLHNSGTERIKSYLQHIQLTTHFLRSGPKSYIFRY
jgi:hypothetical protein